MKKLMILATAFLLVFGVVGTASADYIDAYWSDYDDMGYWLNGGDDWYHYDLSIKDEDSFKPGIDYVTSAQLTFWFDDDGDDPLKKKKEKAWIWIEGEGWFKAGEVDHDEQFGPYPLVADSLDILNYFGDIYVGVYAKYFKNGDGDFSWTGAKLEAWGKEYVAPVPEPATMLLLGTGLVGLAGVGRKKFFKK